MRCKGSHEIECYGAVAQAASRLRNPLKRREPYMGNTSAKSRIGTDLALNCSTWNNSHSYAFNRTGSHRD